MKLFVMRHGDAGSPASPASADDKTDDRARPLTDTGRAQVAQAIVAMRLRGERPNAILASPYARTMETASLVGKAMGVPVTVMPTLEPHHDLGDWLYDVARGKVQPIPGLANKKLMLVGHHDNLVPALARIGDYQVGDVGPLGAAEVRKLKMADDGDWYELWRFCPGALSPAAQPVQATAKSALAPLRAGPKLAT